MDTQNLVKLIVNTLSLDSNVAYAGSSNLDMGNVHEIIVDAKTGERFQISITQIK